MTPQERLRKHQRALEKTQRELDRERIKLENQEKKLVQDIKKSAKNGQMGACKIQAKDLVRTRRHDLTSHLYSYYGFKNQCACLKLFWHGVINTNISPQIHSKVLLNAHPTSSYFSKDTDCPLQ